jgi:hypothetical protein
MVRKQPSSRLGRSLATAITSGTASQATTPFGTETFQIRVSSTLPIWFVTGTSTYTATGGAGETWLPSNVVDYFTVSPGQTFTFHSTSTSSGMVSISELS